MDRNFPAFFSRNYKDGATLRSAQVLKQEAEDIGFEGKDILEYVKEQQKLDREERAAWREDRKRADESEEKKRADEIKIQLAKIQADKELALKEMELQEQARQAQVTASSATTPPPRNKDAKSPSYHLLLMRRTNLIATCYVLNATLKMLVGRRTHGLLS